MSIKQQQEINELRGRLETLEGKINEMGLQPRNVAGTPDPEPEPKKSKKSKAKVEGSE
ncbi:MAG: hypothetical protein JKY81_04585 [Colwellia sp.]|nr:hypothetical protein [Colwellia sp.]